MFCYLQPWRHTVIASCTKPFPDSCKHKRHWNFHTDYGCLATRRENCTEGLFCNTQRICRSISILFAGSQMVNMGFLKNCIPRFGTQKSFVFYAIRIPITFLEQFAFDPILSHMNPVCVSDTVLQWSISALFLSLPGGVLPSSFEIEFCRGRRGKLQCFKFYRWRRG